MKDNDITMLLKKADELRALFLLGQKVIPFLEEIFVFVRDIQPLLDEINGSIKDNIKKMPNASKQITQVTQANELATNEIMDIVDGLFHKSDIISANVKNIFADANKDVNDTVRLLDILYKGIEQGKISKAILPQLSTAIEKLRIKSNSDSSSAIAENENILNSVRTDANSIMISLQVQDITSQQLAAVNHMLITVQEKLSTILRRFNDTEMSDLANESHDESVNVTKLHREIAFDPNAVDAYSSAEDRQFNVDQLVMDHMNQGINEEDDEELDIDALFANNNTSNEVEASNEEVIQEIEQEIIEDNSQDDDIALDEDDIDALFNSSNNLNDIEEDNAQEEEIEADEEEDFTQFSQDDIDALFAKKS